MIDPFPNCFSSDVSTVFRVRILSLSTAFDSASSSLAWSLLFFLVAHRTNGHRRTSRGFSHVDRLHVARAQAARTDCTGRSRTRAPTASATCAGVIAVFPSRSASVRATRRTFPYARADKARRSTADGEEARSRRAERRDALQIPDRQRAVRRRAHFAACHAIALHVARPFDPRPHVRRALPARHRCVAPRPAPAATHVHVEPIEERTTETRAVFLDAGHRYKCSDPNRRRGTRKRTDSSPRTTSGRAGNVTFPWAREIETVPSSSGCRSASSAERRELRQLVEKEHAVVREAHLSRARTVAPLSTIPT